MPPIAIRRSHSALATNGNEMPSASDQSEDVERAVDEHGRERAAAGYPCRDLEPACAKQVADPARKDVVHGDSAHDHLAEAAHGHVRGAGDRSPAQGLDDVDPGHGRDRENHGRELRGGDDRPHLVDVRVAKREPEEECGERHAESQPDDRGTAPDRG